jgi:hypothetical protein
MRVSIVCDIQARFNIIIKSNLWQIRTQPLRRISKRYQFLFEIFIIFILEDLITWNGIVKLIIWITICFLLVSPELRSNIRGVINFTIKVVNWYEGNPLIVFHCCTCNTLSTAVKIRRSFLLKRFLMISVKMSPLSDQSGSEESN